MRLGWANKCLQKAVARLFVGRQRRSAMSFFKRHCANHAKGGLCAEAVERDNFLAVVAFLEHEDAFVWVYESDACADASSAWRLGGAHGRWLGSLCCD